METFAANVWAALQAANPGSTLVAHGGKNRLLPWFFVRAWWHAARAVIGRRCDLVMTGDAVTYVALWPLLAALRDAHGHDGDGPRPDLAEPLLRHRRPRR